MICVYTDDFSDRQGGVLGRAGMQRAVQRMGRQQAA